MIKSRDGELMVKCSGMIDRVTKLWGVAVCVMGRYLAIASTLIPEDTENWPVILQKFE